MEEKVRKKKEKRMEERKKYREISSSNLMDGSREPP